MFARNIINRFIHASRPISVNGRKELRRARVGIYLLRHVNLISILTPIYGFIFSRIRGQFVEKRVNSIDKTEENRDRRDAERKIEKKRPFYDFIYRETDV